MQPVIGSNPTRTTLYYDLDHELYGKGYLVECFSIASNDSERLLRATKRLPQTTWHSCTSHARSYG